MKMAKKVLSVVLAVMLALSCFAVCGSALGDEENATYRAKFTVLGGVGSASITSAVKFTFTDATTTSHAITAEPGDVVYAYVYADNNYYIHTLCTELFYPAGWYTPTEMLRNKLGDQSKSFSKANLQKKILFNTDHPLFSIYTIDSNMTIANEWVNLVDDARNGVAKSWPTDDTGVIIEGYSKNNDGVTPDTDKWNFLRFSQTVNGNSENGVILGPDELYETDYSSSETGYIFRLPLQIPEDAAAGTYTICIPEMAASRTAKPTGFTRITEMGIDPDSGEVDGVIETNGITYPNFTYGNDEQIQYIDYSEAYFTVTIEGEEEEEIDYTALEAKIADVEGTDLTNVLTGADAFTTALTNAQTMATAKNAAAQADVDALVTALTNAYNALVYKADYTELDAAIALAGTKTESDWTADSWAAMQTKLTAANNVSRSLAAADQATVDTAADELNAAINALVAYVATPADYTALNTAIELAGTKTESWYTADSWSAMQTALTNANAVDKNLTSEDQNTIDVATEALNNAIGALVEADANYTALDAAIALAGEKVEANYTAVSWAEMQAKLTAANNVSKTLKAKNQATIDAAATALNDAIDALVEADADYTALDAAIALAGTKVEANYTADSWTAMQTALTAANNVAKDLKVKDQATIDSAATALNSAIEALVEADADYTALDAAIALAGTKTEAWYTADSWTAMQSALTAANGVAKDLKAKDQATIDSAATALNSAIEALVEADADYTALNNAIIIANMKNEANYSEESWANFETALTNANAVAKDLKVKDQATIDAAATALNDAITALVLVGANYDDLDAAIVDFESKTESWYTAETWATAKAAYDDAKALSRELTKADQATIDEKATALVTAINGLVEADADYTALNAAIKAANKKESTTQQGLTFYYYTEETWNAYSEALANANAIETGLKAKDQDTIDAATSALTNAQAALVYRDFDYSKVYEIQNDFAALEEVNYTAASWAAVETAIDNIIWGQTMASFGPTFAKVYALMKAYNALTPAGAANYDEVNAAIDEANALTEADWTAESWAALQTAINAVDKTKNENQQAEVDAMATAINDAIDALVPYVAPLDYSALETAVNNAAEANVVNATDATLEAFQSAYNLAKAMNDGKTATTQDEIDNAANALVAAQNALKYKADYTALDAAKASAAQYTDAAAYTADSWNAFTEALEAANNVAADLTADDQKVIDDATAALNAAIEGLVEDPAADYSELTAALAGAAGLDSGIYTEATWATLEAAVADGNAVPAGLRASSQSVIDNAAAAINSAIDGLVKKDADYTALKAAIATAEQKVESKYTADSWAVLAAALADAKAVPAGLKITDQSDIDKATSDLNAAINALVEKPVEVKGQVTDVDYTPGKGSTNTFTVKVSGRATMVQFQELSNGTGTRTYDRYHKNVTIVSYNEAGEVVNSLDKNIAYEVWTIVTPIEGPEIGVRAKANGTYTWENSELAYKFTYEKAPIANQVISATPVATEGKAGGVETTVITGADVQYIQFKMEDGSTVTLAPKATNTDGTLTFVGRAFMNHEGENVVAIRVLADGQWTVSDVTVNYTVLAK